MILTSETLYKIGENIEELLGRGFDETCIDMETGEVFYDKAEARLEELMEQEGQKIENIALYIKNILSFAAAIKTEEDAFKKRRKAKEKKAEALKRFVANYLIKRNIPKLETEKVLLSFKKSASSNVFNKETFMEYAKEHDYFLRYQEPEINLNAVLAALKDGEVIPGAELVEKQNLQIK